ncbi:MAG TPA: hypothetical protein VF815_05040 [Myxococcaceae bacterium]
MRRSQCPGYWMMAACLLTVGLMSRTAQAQDDFDRYLSSAVQLYESLDYEDALQQIQRAKQLARGIKQDVAVALHEGIILAAMGREEPSEVAFRRGLTLEPEATLPFKVPPKVERSFKKVRASVKKPSPDGGRRIQPPPPPPDPLVENFPRPPDPKPGKKKETDDRPVKPPEPPNLVEPIVTPPAPSVLTLEASERSRVPVVPVALAGAGVVAAGVGAWFGVQSKSNLREVENKLAGGPVPSQSEASAVRAQLDDARGQARVANVLFGTAAAAVTGAIVTYLFLGDDTKSETQEAR